MALDPDTESEKSEPGIYLMIPASWLNGSFLVSPTKAGEVGQVRTHEGLASLMNIHPRQILSGPIWEGLYLMAVFHISVAEVVSSAIQRLGMEYRRGNRLNMFIDTSSSQVRWELVPQEKS